MQQGNDLRDAENEHEVKKELYKRGALVMWRDERAGCHGISKCRAVRPADRGLPNLSDVSGERQYKDGAARATLKSRLTDPVWPG